jgi:hypothetical protein
MALLALVVLGLFGAPPAGAQDGNRAGLVIVVDGEQPITRCVAFAEDEISGMALLTRADLALTLDSSSGMGNAVCAIEATGCPASDCFCQCKGGPECVYWSYWRLDRAQSDPTWLYAAAGATQVRVRAGDVHAWSWGLGSVETGAEPPLLTLADICSDATVVGGDSAESPSPPPTGVPTTYLAFGAVVAVLAAALWLTARRTRA